ncbi:DNA-processing protein DprA [Methylocella silvestris]|uniref:DNA-protecting protein DprA n=1 Tax=Methylocella silvestris TaxID=199596 RepID=A0A2J7TM65_METSI|nr:DNA-processing protein DprA [Methylocella silvestris]PNG27868.1 DNA-protecting protein DprA [Methylocella silvestris]
MTSAAALTPQERFAFLRLYRSETIGPRSFVALLARYGSAQAALEALPGVVASGKAGRPIALAPIHEIEAELEAIERAGAALICLPEPDYPARLRQIHSAPPLLTVRGEYACLKRSKVAIVGSRNASAAGLAFAEQLSRGVARAGHVIVSGLARGIDARAHQAALATGTIAVLAGGLGNIYPAAHSELMERLLEHGAAMSEMPFGWEARGRDFPRRNRIVSGLSRGVVVIEAARRSGSLITAGFAAEQGREVFAVPGSPLDPRAEGPNQLLREGATFCTRAEDVLDALARQDLLPAADFSFAEADGASYEPYWDELELPDILAKNDGAAFGAAGQMTPRQAPASLRRAAPPPADEPRQESAPQPSREQTFARVIELLGPAPVSVDELVRASEAPAREVRAILFELELDGRLERHGADLVSKI